MQMHDGLPAIFTEVGGAWAVRSFRDGNGSPSSQRPHTER